jgi:hypothetical protein
MFTAFIKALLGGALAILRAIPYQVYLLLLAVAMLWWAYSAIYARGDAAARRELAPMLAQAHADAATRMQQAADAEGRALAYERAVNACVGEKASMATITSAVLAQRDRAAAQTQRTLNATRQELANAYSRSPDSCADSAVPAAVLSVLDAAAGQAIPNTDAERGSAGPAVRARAQPTDDDDASAHAPWLSVPRYDGMDSGVGQPAAGMQRGQGGDQRTQAGRPVTMHSAMPGTLPGAGAPRVRKTAVLDSFRGV